MKKLAASILLLVYFLVSTGFVISVHYCMDKLDAVELGHTSKKECGKCGMFIKKSGGCCKDEVKVVKMQLDQSIAKVVTADFSLVLSPPVSMSAVVLPAILLKEEPVSFANGPPIGKQAIYLRNCVFRI